METIYWMQVIASLNVVMVVSFLILSFVLFILVIYRKAELSWAVWFGSEEKRLVKIKETYKLMRKVGAGLFICLLGIIFIPSEKQLYAIYGIGGAIDYIKGNETAKQLPDKVVVALDKYIDSLTKDKEKNND